MGILDTTMDMIAGPRQLRFRGASWDRLTNAGLAIENMNRHEQRLLEKKYAGAEQKLKDVKTVTFELRLPDCKYNLGTTGQ